MAVEIQLAILIHLPLKSLKAIAETSWPWNYVSNLPVLW